MPDTASGPSARLNAIRGYEGGFGVLALPSFVDRRNGWVSVQTVSNRYNSHRFLFRTTDGGATWSRLPQPPAAQREVFSSRSRGWAVVLGSAAATSGQGRGGGLYTTADDRRTLLALVGHEAKKVLTSRDGGHAWTTAATGLEGRYPAVRGLAFADPRTGWAVTGRGVSLEDGCVPSTSHCDGDGALLVSSTGGTTWSDATPTG